MLGDWRTVKLKDVTSKIGSGATPRGGKNSYKESGISLVRSLNVYDFKFEKKALAYIDNVQAERLSNVVVEESDILLNITGASVARCTIVPNDILPARVNQHVAIIRVKENIADPYFVLYSINSNYYKHRLLTLVQGGATREALTKEMIENFEIKLPPLQTQQKIASILSTYDDLIENNNRRIAILEEMAQKLYREWFVKFCFPGYEEVKMVESELGLIPEGWEVVTASDAMKINPRTTLSKEGEKPYLSMSYLSEDSMIIKGHEYRAGNSGTKFKNGDTLFARITPSLENGKTGYVQFLDDENPIGFGSTEFIVLRSKTLSPEYVYCLARSDNFRDNAIKSMTGATGRQRVQNSCFDNYFFAQPSEDVLKQFTDVVQPIFELIGSLHKKNQNLRQQRDLLLPRLISGKIKVVEE